MKPLVVIKTGQPAVALTLPEFNHREGVLTACRIVVAVVLICISWLPGIAQPKLPDVPASWGLEDRVDSLRNALANQSDDSLRYELNLALASEYVYMVADSSLKYLAIAEESLPPENALDHPYILNLKGISLDEIGRYKEAAQSYGKAIVLTEDLDRSGEYDLSDAFITDNVIFRNNLGYALYQSGEYSRALDELLIALDASLQHDSTEIGLIYGSLAELYFSVGDYKQAREFINLARHALNDSASLVYEAGLLGPLYVQEGHIDSARMFYNAMQRYFGPEPSNHELCMLYDGLARIALKTNRYDDALSMARRCLEAAEVLGSVYFQSSGLALQAQAYIGMNKLDEALPLLERAIKFSEGSQAVVQLDEYYRLLAQSYAEKQDYENAFENYLNYNILRDSMLNAQKAKQLSALILEREIERQNARTTELQEMLREDQTRLRRSDSFNVAMLLFALISGFIAFILMRRRGVMTLSSSPLNIDLPHDDKRIFLERIAITMLLLFVPPLIYSLIWTDFLDSAFISGAIVVCLFMFFAARHLNNHISGAVVMLCGYPLITAVVLMTGNSMSVFLWLITLFLIVSYALTNYKAQIANGILATIAFFVMVFVARREGPQAAVTEVTSLDIMIGIVALCTAFMTLYYHKGELFDYRFGLDKTSRLFRLITDLNPNFVFAKDPERRYIFANKAMVDTYDLELGEIIGRRPEEFNEAFRENGHFADDDNRVLKKGETIHIPEEMVYDHQGNEKWLETIKKPVLDDKGKIVGLVGIANDITEKRQALHEQRRSLSLLKATIESTADAILVVDNAYDPVLMNTKFEQLIAGFKPSIVGDNTARINQFAQMTTDPEAFVKQVREIMATGHQSSLDVIEMKDGRVFERYSQPRIENDEVVGRVWSFRDVTITVKATKALASSERLYRTILEDNLFSIARLEGDRVLSANKAFRDLTGYSSHEMQELMLSNLIHGDDYKRFVEATRRVLRSGEHFESIGYRIVGKDGDVRHVLASLKGYFDADGNPIEVFMTAADVTQMVAIEEALAESEKRYRSLVEASPDGIIVTDIKGYVTFVSKRLLEILGLESDETMIGKHMTEFAAPEERERAKSDLGVAFTSTTPIIGRYAVQLEDHGRIYVELGGRRYDNHLGEPVGVIIVLRDITRQARNEEILRESEMRYRSLFESTFDGFIILDPDGKIVDGNQSAIALLECGTIESLAEYDIRDFFTDRMVQEQFDRLAKGELDKSQTLRTEGRNATGEPLYAEISFTRLSSNGKTRIACAIRDIAERIVLEAKEKELQHQEIEMESLNRELTSNALFASQKNKLLVDIHADIEQLNDHVNEAAKPLINKVTRKIKSSLNEQQENLAFKLQFEKIHPNFFSDLLKRCPKLTNNELKYCAYIRMNMSTQDICNLLYVEKKSVEMAKYRIKKKLKLERGQRLGEYLLSL